MKPPNVSSVEELAAVVELEVVPGTAVVGDPDPDGSGLGGVAGPLEDPDRTEPPLPLSAPPPSGDTTGPHAAAAAPRENKNHLT